MAGIFGGLLGDPASVASVPAQQLAGVTPRWLFAFFAIALAAIPFLLSAVAVEGCFLIRGSHLFNFHLLGGVFVVSLGAKKNAQHLAMLSVGLVSGLAVILIFSAAIPYVQRAYSLRRLLRSDSVSAGTQMVGESLGRAGESAGRGWVELASPGVDCPAEVCAGSVGYSDGCDDTSGPVDQRVTDFDASGRVTRARNVRNTSGFHDSPFRRALERLRAVRVR